MNGVSHTQFRPCSSSLPLSPSSSNSDPKPQHCRPRKPSFSTCGTNGGDSKVEQRTSSGIGVNGVSNKSCSRMCCVCKSMVPKTAFSKTQWRKGDKGNCRSCVDRVPSFCAPPTLRPLLASPSSRSSSIQVTSALGHASSGFVAKEDLSLTQSGPAPLSVCGSHRGYSDNKES